MTISQQLELASQQHDRGQLDQAETVYRRILAVEPQNPRALQLMGVMLHHRGNSPAGIELIRRAIQINPLSADFHSNLGVILTDCGRFDEALASYRSAIKLAPQDPDYHWNLAINLLCDGEFREGWDEFEWRLRSPARNLNRGFPQPQWNGSDLTGKTILLHTEGGFGDALQFIRYLPHVAERGGQIILDCQPELIRFFTPLSGISGIFRRFDPLPHFDFQIPLQSLPRMFQTNSGKYPGNRPLPQCPGAMRPIWNQRLASEPGPKVGLVWAGSNTTGGRRSNPCKYSPRCLMCTGIRLLQPAKRPGIQTARSLAAFPSRISPIKSTTSPIWRDSSPTSTW